MSNFPKNVLLREDGPREGFQMHKQFVPTTQKLDLIEMLSQTGVTTIEVTSFVRPDLVPQHKDASELAEALKPRTKTRYTALYLNEKGFVRAVQCKNLALEGFVHLAGSDAFLKRNMNSSLAQELEKLPEWIKLFQAHKVAPERLIISTAFGEPVEGRIAALHIVQIIERAMQKLEPQGSFFEEVTLADTTGWGNPEDVKRLVSEIRSRWPSLILGLHFHDTRGLGIANLYAGLECGVVRYDCSVAGLGGCPFTAGGAGNVPTEDVAFMCEEMGISTGLDLQRYLECARFAEKLVGHELPGKLMKGGVLPKRS